MEHQRGGEGRGGEDGVRVSSVGNRGHDEDSMKSRGALADAYFGHCGFLVVAFHK